MLIYSSRFLTRGEVWFDNPPSAAAVDWILYLQCSRPVRGSRWRFFYTPLIDLEPSPEAILAAMSDSTASDIRYAQRRDGTVCAFQTVSHPRQLEAFTAFYSRFAAFKGLPPLDLSWLAVTAHAGLLELAVARSPQGEPLVYNLLYRDRRRVRGLHLASLHQEADSNAFRRVLARASRLLTWQAMLHYREQQIQYYDLGGWYAGSDDPAKLGINRFKEGFGGRVVREYQCEQILTWKGFAALRIGRLWQRLKSAPRVSPKAHPAPGATPGPAAPQPSAATS